MMKDDPSADRQGPLATASTAELVGRLAEEAKELVKKEVELAKSELRSEVKNEIKMATGLAGAAVAALVTLNLLFVAIVLALDDPLPGWAAALIVAAGTLAIGGVAGAVGWSYRARKLLPLTQKTLKEDAQWAEERLS
jgi:uncharacterized membrane protein YqjE